MVHTRSWRNDPIRLSLLQVCLYSLDTHPERSGIPVWVAWPQEQTGSEDKAGDTQGPTHEAPASRVMDQLFPRLEYFSLCPYNYPLT